MEHNHTVFTADQLANLKQDLNPKLISTRKGSSGSKLQYIQGHSAIDQANRIFGYGNWSFRTLSCDQVVIHDPTTNKAVGVCYKAKVEVTVRGCVAPIVEVGSQPVATCILNEKETNRWTIMESHEQAEKGAVTDALKRALRAFGNQFANGLYGDGYVHIGNVSDREEKETASKTEEANKTEEEALRKDYISYNEMFSIPKMKAFGKRILKTPLEKATEVQIKVALDVLLKARFFLEVARVRDPEFKKLGELGAKLAVKGYPVDHPLDMFGHPRQDELTARYFTILAGLDGDLSSLSQELRVAFPDRIKRLEIKIA